MFLRYIMLFALVSASLWSCKKETAPLDIYSEVGIGLDVNVDGSPLVKGEKLPFDSSGTIVINELRFFISDISFINEQGEKVDVEIQPDEVFLYDLNGAHTFKVLLAESEYEYIKFNVGLAPDLNDQQPVDFQYPHPLSFEHDMYWGMLKYRFFVMEGEMFSLNSNESRHLNYHLGGDAYLRSVILPLSWTPSRSAGSLKIELDVYKIFKDIDWTVFFSFHSEGTQIETGLKMMDNISQSFQ